MTDSPLIPADLGKGPGYEEPWQAQAFACAITLSRADLFSWSEWTEAFSLEIRTHPARPGENPSAAYYRQLLDTLERMILDRRAASSTEIAERIEAWRQAYLNTPHGHAVELKNALSVREAAHAHEHHDAMRKPVAVSPPQE